MVVSTHPSSFPSSLEVASLLPLAEVLSFTEVDIHVHMLDRELVTTSSKTFHFSLAAR